MRPDEFITVKMNHVVRIVGNPGFCFPSDVVRESYECASVRKSRNKDQIRVHV